jgi:hypothetical protein
MREALPASDGTPVGRWHLVFDSVVAWVLDPKGSGVVEQYAAPSHTIHAFAPIQMAPFSSNGQGGITRFGHSTIGGTVCSENGPFGSYSWTVSGNTLTLAAQSGNCPDRNTIWVGTWTRASA